MVIKTVDLGKRFKIETIWAFCSVGEDSNDEGIVGYFDESKGQWFPLVGADETRVNQYREMAKVIAKSTGMKIVCKVFKNFEIVEVIEP